MFTPPAAQMRQFVSAKPATGPQIIPPDLMNEPIFRRFFEQTKTQPHPVAILNTGEQSAPFQSKKERHRA
ncbi:hypothetical protein [Novispirillum itersonii]|uniref:Uncharacterized protein n=1 Tax=Novispirillum itersonii TaxID=189 RepID=A0A7W9ZGM1_NOVIT|nr:hypothetical protein [Novispirillum itersonii]MBB6210875.1 hypothetical protein [Novispirillum itersonii]